MPCHSASPSPRTSSAAANGCSTTTADAFDVPRPSLSMSATVATASGPPLSSATAPTPPPHNNNNNNNSTCTADAQTTHATLFPSSIPTDPSTTDLGTWPLQRPDALSLATDGLSTRTSGDVPRTVKLLSELERSWAMFAASWSVVDLFGGVQIWREQSRELTASEPLNNVLLSTTSAGLVTFVAGHIGGAGFAVSALLTALVVAAAWWTLTGARAKRAVPSFKAVQVVDGSPSEIFVYLMGIKNYCVWDASVETAEVVHTIDDHSDIIHVVYRPVWMWPLWLTPRDLCLLRYWRRAEDGSYIICMQSALHPECPPMHGLVRATCKGGGYIISPRALGVAQGDELTSMVTNVVHLDPQGWEGKLLQRLNIMHLYVRPQVLSLTGLRDVMEARKYVCPNAPEEVSVTFTASTEEQHANAAAVQAGRESVDDPDAPVSRLEEFPSNVPRSMWAEPDGAAMMVRGPDYLADQRKIPSQSPYFRLVGVDLFESSESVEHIASLPGNSVQRELRRHAERGTEMPFTFVVNFVVPGTPRINLVLYYQVPHPSVLTDGSPSSELMADFLDSSDEFRNERFKLIPCIVEGSFIVRQAVGSTPALIGKKLRQPTYRGKQYFELDVDIGSSAVANRVVGLVSGYTKKLVIDMGFVLEGQSPDELPERLFGSVRLVHLDLDVAEKLT